MTGAQLEFDLGELTKPFGAMTAAVDAMIGELNASGRLEVAHLPLVALIHKLATSLEASGGRGASVAMLSAQFQEVWDRLASLPAPDAGAAAPEFDVVLLPVLEPVADAG